MAMRCKLCSFGFLSFLLLLSISSASTSAPDTSADAKAGLYHGPGSCAASSCHGNVQPQKLTRVMQNEYSIWIGQDKHSNAYAVLSSKVSLRMGEILQTKNAQGNPAPPSESPKCLACHALYVPDKHAQPFGLEDGVSCESCHGPSSGWLETHTHRDSHTDSVNHRDMNDLRDFRERSKVCLTCHIGTFENGRPEKYVDHEMIAAGHPDLMFELTYFSFRMPQHWHTPEQDNPWRSVQAWGVGQAIQLRDSMYRLAARAGNSDLAWPEFAEFDCYACHHSLSAAADSWRLNQKHPDYYAGRRPGNVPWNEARVVVFRDLVEELYPETSQKLNQDLREVAVQMNKLSGDRRQVAAAATRAAGLANDLADKLNSQTYDAALTLRLMRRIAANAPTIANAGYGSAAQAAMTLDDLSKAYEQNSGQENSGLSASIDSLNKLFKDQNPSAYSATQFSDRMQNVSKALGVREISAAGSN